MNAAETAVDVFEGLPPIFRECVDRHVPRYDLSTPWREGGHIYATTGRICVRIAVEALEGHVALAQRPAARTTDDSRRTPPVVLLFDEALAWTTRLRALPAESPPPTRACEECRGSGWFDSRLGMACEDCDGTGTWRNSERVEVAPGYFLAAHFVDLLRRHECRVWIPARLERDNQRPARFLDPHGTEGLVMPMTPPKMS
jgi:hypothetical protein